MVGGRGVGGALISLFILFTGEVNFYILSN